MERKRDWVLDGRTAVELRAQVAELARSYTPEWRFDPDHPDVGSTLALIYTNQMADNLRRLNQAIDKCHTEFVNLLGISLQPAHPASGVVTAELIRETIPGAELPRGAKLVGAGEDGEPVLFETTGDLYLTAARLTDAVALSERFGKVIPLLGGPRAAAFLPGMGPGGKAPAGEPVLPPVSLFDYTDRGEERNALLLYHKSIFDVGPGAAVTVRLGGGEALADPARYRWSYYSGKALVPFRVTEGESGCVRLEREGESVPVRLDGEDYHLVCLEHLGSVEGTVELADIQVSSACGDTAPDFVSHNDRDQEIDKFLPFGDSASLFDECYIGHDRIFSQRGALVTARFHLSFEEKLVTFTPQQETESLKIVKRKPKTVLFDTVSTSPQQITLEYYNAIGWRRLNCTADWSSLFDGTHPGDTVISFRCPDDWQPTAVSGYETRALRIRLVRADNCYLQPCVHTMPVVEGLKLSYAYDGRWALPQRLRAVWGCRLLDLTRPLQEGKPLAVFRPLPHPGNSLCLGFDAPMEGAPVSLFFDVAENTRFESAPIAFEYSTAAGWKPLKVIDGTGNMSRPGAVMFSPPSDFAPREVEGVSRRWLRLVDERRAFDDPARHHALIKSILLNTVEIRNVETREEESFYVRNSAPGLSFPLSAENILSAEVFVSEKDNLTQPAMQQLLHRHPEDVRVEYDFLGGIRSFFVRWTEVENFDRSHPEDRHYIIDRMNNRILFGDGVRVRIPPAQSGVAFTAQVKCCRGEKGNLPAGAVSELFDHMLYVDRVHNPVATFAGSNLESLASAHRRGASVVSGRGRLVTELDYVREVAAFSDGVAKVRCAAGLDQDGREAPGLLTVAVMMRDYADGAYSFHNLRDRLRERLFSRSEATLGREELLLTEPVYVEITLDVWAEADDAQRSFDMQNRIRDGVDAFLDPLGRNGEGGWEIGALPTEAQLRMMLHSLQGPMRVKRFLASARYTDRRGSHECTLDALPANPFAVAVSGRHKIYIELKD